MGSGILGFGIRNTAQELPESGRVRVFFFLWGGRVLSRIYHLGEKSWVAESDKPPRGVRSPRKFFEMNMHWDAIWCILRHNFEKCYSVCTNLVASWWFFRYSYLYTVMITLFFWGGSFYPSNTLDRTLGEGGSRGSNEPPLQVNDGGLKTQAVNFQLLANSGGMENKLWVF